MNPRPDHEPLASIPGVCEVDYLGPSRDEAPAVPGVLIEIPHGATRRAHFDTLARRLTSRLPEDLEAFFFVNTDVGAPECAREVAHQLVASFDGATSDTAHPPPGVIIVRSVIPRTFIDCNRMIDGDAEAFREAGVTPAWPGYIESEADRALLRDLHERYQAVAAQAYEQVCASGGLALALHTYAPRSVDIRDVDAGIVKALRTAYEPETYASWPPRPEVDLITADGDGRLLTSARWIAATREAYAQIGVTVAENATYRLHPATWGHRHGVDWPEQVLCVEINRELLADPFSPFEEMTIGPQRAARMAGPLAAALRLELRARLGGA